MATRAKKCKERVYIFPDIGSISTNIGTKINKELLDASERKGHR
jgi:hypothetical protein